jgi:hypothetical protein
LTVGERTVAADVLAVDHREHGTQCGREVGLGLAEVSEEIVDRGAVGEVHGHERGRGEPVQPGAQTDPHAHCHRPPPPRRTLRHTLLAAAPGRESSRSAGGALEVVIEHPEWLRLDGRRVAVLGAGAETSSLETLSSWGVEVLAQGLRSAAAGALTRPALTPRVD